MMAIAITLLILNRRVDPGYAAGHGLWRAGAHEWPEYLAYLTAFVTIAIMWLNHHALFDNVAAIDKPLAWTNVLHCPHRELGATPGCEQRRGRRRSRGRAGSVSWGFNSVSEGGLEPPSPFGH